MCVLVCLLHKSAINVSSPGLCPQIGSLSTFFALQKAKVFWFTGLIFGFYWLRPMIRNVGEMSEGLVLGRVVDQAPGHVSYFLLQLLTPRVFERYDKPEEIPVQ